MSPSVLYPGAETVLFIDPASAPANQMNSTFLHMVDIKLDGVELDINPFVNEENGIPVLGSNWK